LTTLHLIRHGQTDWNLERRIQGQTDSTLSDDGRAQAASIANELSSHPFAAAYSSSSVRARDTATAILRHHAIELQLRDEMREILLGAWEGRLYQDVKEQDPINHGYFAEDPSRFALDGAETFYQVQARAMALVNDLVQQHPGEQVLLVSHGIWIKTILTHIEQRPMKNFWRPPQMENCCHSIIEFNQDQAKIIQYAGLVQW